MQKDLIWYDMLWYDSACPHNRTHTHRKVYLLCHYSYFESNAYDRYFELLVSVIIFYIERTILPNTCTSRINGEINWNSVKASKKVEISQTWFFHRAILMNIPTTDAVDDRCTDWLTDFLSHFLSHWLSHWLTGWLADWYTDWLYDWLTDWLPNWLTDWLTDSLTE